MVQVNWLLNERPFSAKDQLALAVLDHLLMGTAAATLRKALTDSGLGAEVIGGGLSDELSQATFAAGLKGVKPGADADAVEELVHATLRAFAESGPDLDAVEASMNTVEFSLREFNTGSFPRGLSFMLGAMSQWIYDRDPLAGLRFEAPLQELKDDIAAGKPVFGDLVRTLLLDNGHKVTVEMVPDPKLEERQVKDETARLQAIKAGMGDQEIAAAVRETARLKASQSAHDTPEQLATIPSLGLSDLSADPLELDNLVSVERGVTVLRHVVPSNGILYADVGLDLTVLGAQDLPLVPLFSRCLTSCGTGHEDEVSLSRRIGATTGGVYATTFTGVEVPADGSVSAGDALQHRLFLRGKAVLSKSGALFSVLDDVLKSAQLGNRKRIVEMLKESKARLEASLVDSGHAYASTRLSSHHTTAGALGEATGGVAYLAFLKQTLHEAEADFPALQAKLEAMRACLLSSRSHYVVNLSGDRPTLDAAQPALDAFLQGLDAGPDDTCEPFSEAAAPGLDPPVPAGRRLAEWDLKGAFAAADEGFVVPTQVNYVGKGGRLYEVGEKVSGSASVVSRALRSGYLWDTVRVMGGAYGGFCRFSALTGTFSFLSYRDPNLAKTLELYDGSGAFLEAQELTDEALTQAIIGAVGDLDGPLGPDQKGWEAMRRWLVKETPEMRKQWRDEILGTTKEDFQAFGSRLTQMASADGPQMNSVVFSSKGALEEANEKGAKFTLTEVLS